MDDTGAKPGDCIGCGIVSCCIINIHYSISCKCFLQEKAGCYGCMRSYHALCLVGHHLLQGTQKSKTSRESLPENLKSCSPSTCLTKLLHLTRTIDRAVLSRHASFTWNGGEVLGIYMPPVLATREPCSDSWSEKFTSYVTDNPENKSNDIPCTSTATQYAQKPYYLLNLDQAGPRDDHIRSCRTF